MNKTSKIVAGIIGLVAAFFIVFLFCIRPYDKPTFAEVESNETAFLIPLFSDNGIKQKTRSKLILKNTIRITWFRTNCSRFLTNGLKQAAGFAQDITLIQ